jgi:hypothetical protein
MATIEYDAEMGLIYVSVGIGDLPGLELAEARQLAKDLLSVVEYEESLLSKEDPTVVNYVPPCLNVDDTMRIKAYLKFLEEKDHE